MEIPLELAPGYYARWIVRSDSIDLITTLLGPDGGSISKTERPNDRLSLVTLTGGTYRLIVEPFKKTASGRFTATLQELRPAQGDDGERLAAEEALATAGRLRLAGDFGKAIEQADEALCRWRKVQDREGEFEALFETGTNYYRLLRKEEAALCYEEAIRSALASGDDPEVAKGWKGLCTALADKRPEEARGCFEVALLLWEALGNVAQQADVLFRLGHVQARLGRSDEAFATYRQALALAESVGGLPVEAEILNGLGAAYAARGESREALEHYERALKRARETGNEGVKPGILTGFGLLHRRRGEPQKALSKLLEALEINHKRGDVAGEVPVRNNLGPVYLDLGQTDKAREMYEEILRLLRPEGNAGSVITTLLNLAQVDLATSRNEQALERSREALDLSRQAGGVREAVALHYVGVAKLRLGQLPDAVQSLERALSLRRKVKEPLGEAWTLLELGKTYQELGDLDRAVSLMQEAVQLAHDVEASFLQAESHFGLAHLEQRRGHLLAALTQIEQAIEILESVKSDLSDDRLRSSFFSSKRSYYDFFVSLLMQLDGQTPGQGYASRALAASEMGRARSLLDLLAEGRLDLTRGIDPGLKEKESDVRARLSQIQRQLTDELSQDGRQPIVDALRKRLYEVEEERQNIERKIREEHPLYATVRYPSPLRLEDIRGRLDGGSALLEYSLGEGNSYLFVVTKENLAVHTLPSPQEITEEVGKFRTEVEKPGQLSFAYLRQAHRLYEMLIAPAQGSITGKRRLLIAPDGPLHFLSFEALLSSEARGTGDLPYLLRDFSISYIPSASVLAWLTLPRSPVADGPEPPKQFVAFADPDYGVEAPALEAKSADLEIQREASGGWRLPRLEGSEREVSEIAERYPPASVMIYRRQEANEKNVKNNDLVETAQRIHFATHGLADEERPEFSGLALTRTDDPGDDGFLRVYEIFNLNLNAELVVLSACETGRGKEMAGEGLVGITRAFLYAGAPSVVVSLWRVADAAAPPLMLQFYENLDRSGDKAEALRQAKLAMIRDGGKHSHPYYWAPFILVGAPR